MASAEQSLSRTAEAKAKRFVPLENNPDVMTSLVRKLGVTNLSFQDVYSIDEPELLSFVPRPAYALLLVFPVSETYERFKREEDEKKEVYEGSGEGEEVVWFRQTIRNACGLIGLLHAASNGGAKEYIEPQSDLSALLKEAIPLKPTERAELLYESQALETAHSAAASQGDTVAPSASDEVDLHYVCFVTQNGILWELDGGRKGPLKRGELDPSEDVLSERALELGVRSFLKREEAAGGGDLRFSLMVLAPGMD